MVLPQREWALSAPRRMVASSITSSWYSVPRWVSSQTTADRMTPLVFPVAMLSNSFVPTGGMPAWLRVIADWNPVSSLTQASRHLFGSPGTVTSNAWPMQHPVAASLLWSFAPTRRRRRPRTLADVPATSLESVAMAKELKRRGFRFVGPTTAYALMQATGMVDEHLVGCFRSARS